MLRVLLVGVLARDYEQNGDALARRLGLVDEKHPEGEVYAPFAALPDERLRGVIVELSIAERGNLRDAYAATGVELPPPVDGLEVPEPAEAAPEAVDEDEAPSEPPPASSPKPRARRGRAVSA